MAAVQDVEAALAPIYDRIDPSGEVKRAPTLQLTRSDLVCTAYAAHVGRLPWPYA